MARKIVGVSSHSNQKLFESVYSKLSAKTDQDPANSANEDLELPKNKQILNDDADTIRNKLEELEEQLFQLREKKRKLDFIKGLYID